MTPEKPSTKTNQLTPQEQAINNSDDTELMDEQLDEVAGGATPPPNTNRKQPDPAGSNPSPHITSKEIW